MLEFEVNNQTITRLDKFIPASESLNYLKAEFDFKTDDWDDCTKTAIFEVNGVQHKAVLDNNNKCQVPNGTWDNTTRLSKINMKVSVVGERVNYRITTTEKMVQVNRAGYNPNGIIDPAEQQLNDFMSGVSEVIRTIENAGVTI